jgi:enterochelin esterase-like enzyme
LLKTFSVIVSSGTGNLLRGEMMRSKVHAIVAAATAAALLLVTASALGASGAAQSAQGTVTTSSFRSATLGENIAYTVYLPSGYPEAGRRYPVLYLLHGRGDTMSAWTRVKDELDALITSGEIPPVIAVMPDAPWSSRASYYVDSKYEGSDPGRKVETAFIRDLLPHVDATYRTMASRLGRAIGGYSMGGYGALRYSLVYPELFGASIVLSPAVYVPTSPKDSSTREFGAFGEGGSLFVDAIYRKLNYPEALGPFAAKGLPTHMFIAVGDDEFKNPDPADAQHDLDFEAHVLFNRAVRTENLTAELRVLDGGHDWDVWSPGFVEGAKYIFQFIGKAPATPMNATLTGTAGQERAGGVAVDATGNVYEAMAAAGSVAGQLYAGDKDLVLVKYAPNGTRLWTREIGTAALERAYGVAIDPLGHAVVTGYTRGDLDGSHAGNTTDDVFVARFASDGTLDWVEQLGVAAVADRGYAVATDAAGAVYVTGYTRGNLAAPNQGDKDVYLAKLDSAGNQLWIEQFGSAGEEKAWGVVVRGGAVYLAGMTAGALGTPAGSTDGFLARFDGTGARLWLTQFGTSAGEEAWSLTADATGNAYVAGYSAGDFAGSLVGDKDIVVARFDPTGALTWSDQLGTTGNDKGAGVALDAAGNVYVAGFTDGALQSSVGKFDGVLVKYGPGGDRQWTRQFGTTEDDGADEFAEFNLYLATHAGEVFVSGLTLGDTAGASQIGLGDVFLATFDATGANT